MKAQTYYTNRINELNQSLKKVQKKYQLYTFLRLFFFLLAGNAVFFLWGSLLVIPFFLFFIALFLLVVHFSVDAKYKRDRVVTLIEINNKEINVLKGDWSSFQDGVEFRDSKHPFSLDMDIFGKKSVFQLLNRTVSHQGKLKLATTLLNGSNQIGVNNACIAELEENISWCQDFMAEGIVRQNEKEIEGSLKSMKRLNIEMDFSLKVLRYLIPIVAFGSTALLVLDLLSSTLYSGVIIIVLSMVGQKMKRTNAIAQGLTYQSDRVKTILKQLELYKELKVKNPLFQKEQDELLNEGNGVISEMKELDKIMGRFDYRMNLVVGIVLNFFLAWDFLILFQMNNWLNKNGNQLEIWEDKLSEMEVWISGAIYKFNNENATFAAIDKDVERIEIIQLSHPFVDQSKSVKNDVMLNEHENFIIITGPNMAGKSTYLRSLGLTFVMANAGFPVLAASCKLPQLKLFSSMRTSDDLTEESSYFHAELIRLRFIMDAIERGEKVFIILDEILKGTNSKDKEIGSAKFLQKLKRLYSKGIIATHDLSLCNLANDDQAFKNMCFDSTIECDTLSFDYKINQGVCKNMNASFLLKQMNLIDF